MSEWAAPMLIVPKKNGKLRFWLYYHSLSYTTVEHTHPLLRMDNRIDTLGHAEYFITLDDYSRYFQVKIR